MIALNLDDDRVVELPSLAELGNHSSNLVIGISKRAGIYLHHSGIKPLLRRGERIPGGNSLWARGKIGIGRYDAFCLLKRDQIGRESGRARVCKYVGIPVVGDAVKKKK